MGPEHRITETNGSTWLTGAASVPDSGSGDVVDTVVVGAGLTGVMTATLLSRAGQRVALLDANPVAAGTTGRSTAKVTVLQATRLSQIADRHGLNAAAGHLAAGREGQQWLRQYCWRHDLDMVTAPAVTYAVSGDSCEQVRREHAVARRLGLPVQWHNNLDLPFPISGAVELPDQFAIDPVAVTRAVAHEFVDRGGILRQQCRVRTISDTRPTTVTSDCGSWSAQRVVLATGTPILNRTLPMAELTPIRSYVMVAETATVPPWLLFGMDDHSVRPVVGDDGSAIMVGGGAHRTGHGPAERDQLAQLESWLLQWWPDARPMSSWSAQDHHSGTRRPIVGRLPRLRAQVHTATGYGQWGITNAVAAGLVLARRILADEQPAWAATAYDAPLSGAVASAGCRDAIRTGGIAIAGMTGGGERLSRICPHMGGTVRWNGLEHTWDCPLHGSRFAADGSVLDGPATRPLTRLGRARRDPDPEDRSQ